jgi:hypothetical protein
MRRAASCSFTIDVERATMPTPPTCTGGPASTAHLATSFTLQGHADPLVAVHATQDWQCHGAQLSTP